MPLRTVTGVEGALSPSVLQVFERWKGLLKQVEANSSR